MERLSAPIITLSLACSNSIIPTLILFFLAAKRAASFIKFAKSAPEKPGVPLAIILGSTFLAKDIFFI